MSGKDTVVESTNLQRAYRFNQLEHSRLRGRLTTLERDRVRTNRVNGYEIRKIASNLDFIKLSSGSSPEGVPPGSADRQMNDSTATMYGDHVYLQPGMGNSGRQRAQSAKRSNSSGHSGRAGGCARVRAATAGVQRAPRPQSTGRPTTGAFGTAWIRRDTADSDSDYDATLSTVSDSSSETSGADGNKQTTVTWQGTAARANRRRPRAPARQYDFLRKGGKSVEEQLMAKSCARQQQVMQMKMAINEERRRALDARLNNFWTHYPLEPWYAQ